MKFKKYIILLLLLSFTGCGMLIPKKVEYFQDKVKAVPAANDTHIETRKEAAAFVAEKTHETVTAAIKEDASTNVLKPAVEAEIVASSLSGSLGKPEDPWKKDAARLAARLDRMDAKLDQSLEDFRQYNDKNEGKKIEGTGVLQMGYFTHLILIVIIFFIGYICLKVVGTVYAPVGLGTSVISGGIKGISTLFTKATSEIIQGGEKFKEYVDKEIQDPAVKAKVNDLFLRAHMERQSDDVQKLVKQISA